MRRTDRSVAMVAALLAALGAPGAGLASDETRIPGPDGRAQFSLLLHESRLSYSVTFRDRAVIEASPMVFTVDGVDLAEDVVVDKVTRYQVNETYPWRGVHARAVNRCEGARFSLKHGKANTGYTLEVRAFDDGVAFRFIVPGDDRRRVPDEATTVVIPAGSDVWYHDLGGHYEGVHNRRSIADVKAGEWAAPPLTFRLPGGAGYASITEAALVNYSGMALRADGKRGFTMVLGHEHPVSYPFRLRYKGDIERVSRPAAIPGTISSPWRVVMVAADLNTLVNSDIIHNLCPPADPKLFGEALPTGAAFTGRGGGRGPYGAAALPDGARSVQSTPANSTAWIKPGRAVWRYLDGGASTLDGMKEFSRLAGELGFEYHVIEGFWSRWTDDQIRELVDYSRRQGVGLWFWRHSRELRTPEAREAFFRRLHDLGVVGAKIDFFDHEHRDVVDLYAPLLEDAARHRIMVNFHGANKPTGEPRTWPNELVREAVRGMEASRLKDRATHNVTLPFTRYLAGHGDYTPVHFGERRGNTTWAHQIASAAVFTSPLLTYAAQPANILKNPGVEMIKSIPAVWDETIVLPPSEIGELAAFARRSGGAWFLAILNGPAARTVNIPLSFLGPGEYRAMLIRDSKDDAAAVGIENTTRRRGDWLSIGLREGGGFIARFSRTGSSGAELPAASPGRGG